MLELANFVGRRIEHTWAGLVALSAYNLKFSKIRKLLPLKYVNDVCENFAMQ